VAGLIDLQGLGMRQFYMPALLLFTGMVQLNEAHYPFVPLSFLPFLFSFFSFSFFFLFLFSFLFSFRLEMLLSSLFLFFFLFCLLFHLEEKPLEQPLLSMRQPFCIFSAILLSNKKQDLNLPSFLPSFLPSLLPPFLPSFLPFIPAKCSGTLSSHY